MLSFCVVGESIYLDKEGKKGNLVSIASVFPFSVFPQFHDFLFALKNPVPLQCVVKCVKFHHHEGCIMRWLQYH